MTQPSQAKGCQLVPNNIKRLGAIDSLLKETDDNVYLRQVDGRGASKLGEDILELVDKRNNRLTQKCRWRW